ncbi:MAG TPA: hypothetical protein VK821_17655 [Dehalococcoidia bacterium]|nr:hypothetical protein [Dehalococcoidia bacterium]
MASGNGGERMTRAELTTFAQKVEDWVRSLTVREQEFLTELIARAASVEQADVHGYAANLSPSKWQPPVESPPPPTAGNYLTFEFLAGSFLRVLG